MLQDTARVVVDTVAADADNGFPLLSTIVGAIVAGISAAIAYFKGRQKGRTEPYGTVAKNL